MTILFLRPVDVWLFRDGRPFDAGSTHRAESLFPPYPTVIQGALRTHRLLREGVDLSSRNKTAREKIESMVGTADDYKNLRLRGPIVAKLENSKVMRYYPQPADAILIDEEKNLIKASGPGDKSSNTLKTSQEEVVLFNAPIESRKQKRKLWISEKELISYLEKNDYEAAGTPEDQLFVRENRTGIEIENSRRIVKEGMLYEAEFIRPQENVGLLVEVEGDGYLDYPQNGVIQMGGESRASLFEQVTTDPFSANTAAQFSQGFKVFFATPAYFENGWKSKDWSQFFDGNASLVAAALGRYESIGGFDRAKNNHKPSYRYVPAGSVYYFKTNDKVTLKPNDTDNRLTQFAITDNINGAKIGFGQTIIKEWKP